MKASLRIPLLLFASATMLFPLAWMVKASLHPHGEAIHRMLEWPDDPQWENYSTALERMGARANGDHPWLGFLRLGFNTLLITGLSILFQLFTCSLAGYAIACLRFRGRDFLFVLVLGRKMIR